MIFGPGAMAATVNGNQSNRVFEILSGVTASISGLCISNGLVAGTNATSGGPASDGNGGGILNNGTLSLSNCWVVKNTARGGSDSYSLEWAGKGSGGGIQNGGTLALIGCTISGNTASVVYHN